MEVAKLVEPLGPPKQPISGGLSTDSSFTVTAPNPQLFWMVSQLSLNEVTLFVAKRARFPRVVLR